MHQSIREEIIYQIGSSNEFIIDRKISYKDILEQNKKLKPIKSFGIILYLISPTGEVKFLLAQLRDTFAYIDFIKANIPIGQTERYIDMMTTEEKSRISDNFGNFEFLWRRLWSNTNSPQFIGRFKECYCRFLINIHQHGKYILKNKEQGLNSPGWIFPKGRPRKYESILDCAKREFQEETRIPSSFIEIEESFQDNKTYQENYIGTDDKSYYSGYFVAKYKGHNPPIKNYKVELGNSMPIISDEIRDLKWIGIEEASLLLEDENKRFMLKILHNRIMNDYSNNNNNKKINKVDE